MSKQYREGALTIYLLDLGRRLKTKRHEIGITQEEAAEGLGVSPQAIRNWEAGRHEPTQEHLSTLAKLYGFSATDDLLPPQPGARDLHSLGTQRVSVQGYVPSGTRHAGNLGEVPVPDFILAYRPNVFGMVVAGDSLSEFGMEKGDIILVDPDATPNEPGLHAFRTGNAFMVRIVEPNSKKNLSVAEHYSCSSKSPQFNPSSI